MQDKQAKQDYAKLVKEISPKPPLLKNVCWAFIVGGIICCIGQGVMNYFAGIGLGKQDAAAATSILLIFVGAFLTGLGVYDELVKYGGAGAIVPITGFANSIVSSAMEFKREGYVLGVGARMFLVAGPVLVYGMVTAFFIGIIYWMIR